MSATGIDEVRIYHAGIFEEQAQQRAEVAIRILAAGLVRALHGKSGSEGDETPRRRPRVHIPQTAACGSGL